LKSSTFEVGNGVAPSLPTPLILSISLGNRLSFLGIAVSVIDGRGDERSLIGTGPHCNDLGDDTALVFDTDIFLVGTDVMFKGEDVTAIALSLHLSFS